MIMDSFCKVNLSVNSGRLPAHAAPVGLAVFYARLHEGFRSLTMIDSMCMRPGCGVSQAV